MISATGEACPVGSKKREVRLQQHRSIDVGDATLECILCGSGAPVVLLANAGCSTGYFDQLARVLTTRGFLTISIKKLYAIKSLAALGLGRGGVAR